LFNFGAAGRNRTHDPLVRSQHTLYFWQSREVFLKKVSLNFTNEINELFANLIQRDVST